MSFLTGNSIYGQASISGLNDIYCDNLVATGDITCKNIYSDTTTDLQAQIDALENLIDANNGIWGSFYSTIDQPNPVADTVRYMTVNNYDASNNGVVWYNSDGNSPPNYREIQVLVAGTYNVQFSAQLKLK